MRQRISYAVVLLMWTACGESAPPDTGSQAPVGAHFTEVTNVVGLGGFSHTNGGFGEAWAPEIVGGGGGFLDYNGDQLPDIMLVAGGAFQGRMPTGPAVRLYRNNGDGSFVETTTEAGLADLRAYAFGITAADYDNDGDQDVFVSTLYRDLLLRNDGNVFVEVGEQVGLGGVEEWSSSALFFDAGRDGHLDLYVGTYVDWSPEKDIYCGFNGEKVYCTPELYDGIWGRYYRNNGDGTFQERTEQAGFTSGIEAHRDKTLGVATFDANGDAWPDLVVANDTERDLLFLNDGDGTFTESGIRSGIAYDQHGKPRAGMGIDVGVVDASGEPTIFVGNFTEETVGVYRHTGGGLYMDRAASSRIGQPSMMTLTFGLMLFDVDLDTDLDLYIANGHVQTHIARIVEGVTFRQRAQLFINTGDGLFEEAHPESELLSLPMVGRGAAYGDYDRDGDVDVLVIENNGSAHLWRNDLEGRNYLRVRLEGRESNRDGLGASVVLTAGDKRQFRYVHTGSSFLAQSETIPVFGLGEVETVDSLSVIWPAGTVDRLGLLEANQEVRLVEGSTLSMTKTQ